MKNIRVEYKDMPIKVRGCTIEDKEEYIIWINMHLNQEEQEKVYKHELTHIINDDFHSNIPISKLERIRHQGEI